MITSDNKRLNMFNDFIFRRIFSISRMQDNQHKRLKTPRFKHIKQIINVNYVSF